MGSVQADTHSARESDGAGVRLRRGGVTEAFGKMPALTHVFLYGTAVAADTNELERIRRDAPDPVRFFIAF